MTRHAAAAQLCRATLHNSIWYLGQLITFLAIGEETDGRFSLLRVQGSQENVFPAHYHTREDETIYLLNGELTVHAGGEELHVHPGEMVAIPRGLEHDVRHVSAQVTYLVQFTPAGFEHYFHEMSAPAEYLSPPPNPTLPTPTDLALTATTAARYGCVVTGADMERADGE